jgi:phytanoyl-CoA hydroxylase
MESAPEVPTSYFGAPDKASGEPKDYYEKNGYYICRNLIPKDMIDELVQRYLIDIVPSDYPFFRQNTDAYERSNLTAHGYVKQSFLDIHDYEKFPRFSKCAREIFTSTALKNALTEVTGFTSFNLMQTMLFDANTETVPHQDWWYLDTVPNGSLLGAWIALEDIDERAGRFFVMPRSFNVDLHSDAPNLPHVQWLERIKRYVEEHHSDILAPPMKKGDVLFWNSRTIHGSLPTLDPAFSRKSLTAHYMPSHMSFGNLFVKKEYIEYKIYNGMRFHRNQPDYSLTNKLKFAVKVHLYNSPRMMRILRGLQKLPHTNRSH